MTRTLLAALLIVTHAPSLAADRMYPIGSDQMHLYYRDLDTRTAAGRAELLHRVERAAARLCREEIGYHRTECAADTLRTVAKQPDAGAIALALLEQAQPRLASR